MSRSCCAVSTPAVAGGPRDEQIRSTPVDWSPTSGMTGADPVVFEPSPVGNDAARDSSSRRRLSLAGQRGQATAEYALVLLGAAAVALLVVAWATKTDLIGDLLDSVMKSITDQAGGR
ncbi:MAG: DUF4244 domain-containing protein [Acidimicrobiales bacterium]